MSMGYYTTTLTSMPNSVQSPYSHSIGAVMTSDLTDSCQTNSQVATSYSLTSNTVAAVTITETFPLTSYTFPGTTWINSFDIGSS